MGKLIDYLVQQTEGESFWETLKHHYVPSSVPSNVPGSVSEMSRLAAHLSYAIPTMTQTNQSKALNVLLTLDKKQLSTHDIITKKCRPTVIRLKK